MDQERVAKLEKEVATITQLMALQQQFLVDLFGGQSAVLGTLYALASTHPNKDLVQTRIVECHEFFEHPAMQALLASLPSAYTQQVRGALDRAIGLR